MAIILVGDLPAALQSAEMIDLMVAGANARAARVAPCLVSPVSEWAALTAYTVDQTVRLSGGEALQVSTAGTSAASAPTAPSLGETVTDGTVTWTRIAPTADQLAEAMLVLVGAVKRWAESGAGALSAQTAGPFGMTVDTRQRTGFNLWPSEIEALQEICASGTDASSGAFSITPYPGSSAHMPWCSLLLGALYCSCGADLTNYEYPLYEGGVLSGGDGYDTGDFY